jgi:hypothetical protein
MPLLFYLPLIIWTGLLEVTQGENFPYPDRPYGDPDHW